MVVFKCCKNAECAVIQASTEYLTWVYKKFGWHPCLSKYFIFKAEKELLCEIVPIEFLSERTKLLFFPGRKLSSVRAPNLITNYASKTNV